VSGDPEPVGIPDADESGQPRSVGGEWHVVAFDPIRLADPREIEEVQCPVVTQRCEDVPPRVRGTRRSPERDDRVSVTDDVVCDCSVSGLV
jgi:hypothetical protein